MSEIALILFFTLVLTYIPFYTKSHFIDPAKANFSTNLHYSCPEKGEECFENSDCCAGFKCFRKRSTQLSGKCVEKKCRRDSDCKKSEMCHMTGRSDVGLCMKLEEMDDRLQWTLHMYQNRKRMLGCLCETSSDCNEYMEDKKTRLCCQDVVEGRHGVRRKCDRVYAGYSRCL